MHDLEVLIARTRAVQGSAGAPNLGCRRDLDRLVRRLETECRQLHGHYMASRGRRYSRICDHVDARAERRVAQRLARPEADHMPPSELYLVRHAIAAERGDEWPDDTKRPLTERGISRFKEAVGGLKRLDVAIDEIFTSPLVRARQTADLLAAGVDGKPTVKMLDALAPGHTPAR